MFFEEESEKLDEELEKKEVIAVILFICKKLSNSEFMRYNKKLVKEVEESEGISSPISFFKNRNHINELFKSMVEKGVLIKKGRKYELTKRITDYFLKESYYPICYLGINEDEKRKFVKRLFKKKESEVRFRDVLTYMYKLLKNVKEVLQTYSLLRLNLFKYDKKDEKKKEVIRLKDIKRKRIESFNERLIQYEIKKLKALDEWPMEKIEILIQHIDVVMIALLAEISLLKSKEIEGKLKKRRTRKTKKE